MTKATETVHVEACSFCGAPAYSFQAPAGTFTTGWHECTSGGEELFSGGVCCAPLGHSVEGDPSLLQPLPDPREWAEQRLPASRKVPVSDVAHILERFPGVRPIRTEGAELEVWWEYEFQDESLELSPEIDGLGQTYLEEAGSYPVARDAILAHLGIEPVSLPLPEPTWELPFSILGSLLDANPGSWEPKILWQSQIKRILKSINTYCEGV